MNLIIVESPTKAKTLSRFLGKGYEIEATMGHIKDLPKSELGIDTQNNFEPRYDLMEKRKGVISKLKSVSRKAAGVFLATDPDREGEAISYHIKEVISNKKISRIVFHEITKEAVEEAIKNPRTINKNLVDAQIARRVLDRLVGYKLSPLLWKKVRRGLSAGRVQSVAVRLIVEKEKEIEAFNPIEYWDIWCDVHPKGAKNEAFPIRFVGTLDKKIEVSGKSQAGEVTSRLKKAGYRVLDVKKKEVTKSPYPPFTTSTLTQAAARIFGWSAKRTMSVAQKLYERGLITYHRTDSTFISSSALSKVREFIKTNYGEKYLPKEPRFFKVKSKLAQEAHEAVRPTSLNSSIKVKSEARFARDEQTLYGLIWGRFVACQMSPSTYDETAIDVVADSSPKYLLRASGQVIKFDGWRKVIPAKKEEDAPVRLPELQKDRELTLIKVNSEQKFTQPPARFNEASLIKTLEALGIGRPSTYAPIITTIQLRNYVEKTDGKFFPTPIGKAVNSFLMEYFPDVFDYGFTAEMEDTLDKVAEGKNKWQKGISRFFVPFEKKLKKVEANSKRVKIEVEKLGKDCPKCKSGELVIRIGRFGKFISCSDFPKCDYTEKYMEKIGMKCPDCKDGDVIVKKTSRGRRFFGCSRYPDCKWASWHNPNAKRETDSSRN